MKGLASRGLSYLSCELPKGVTMSKTQKTSAENRKCSFPNCTRILSIYNHEQYCHVHREVMAHQDKPKFPAYHHVNT
jgi:hypothetical protein